MIYGYEQPVQLPTLDLYDNQIMAMALNAAKDMYDRNEQNLKEFYKTYGDFISPIAADQAWWDQNISGAARRLVNDIYARGGDPLRDKADMAILQQFINSRPYGEAALVKQSAENAKEYQKARRELEMKGLYNPLVESYAGPSLDSYSTKDNGVWDRMSPVPYQNMSDFSKSYFEGIKPIERHAVKDGVQYTISEITPERLHQIADDHFNDLVNTPQGQLMYKMYKDKLGSDEAAREAFNNAVVSGNLKRVMSDDNFNEQQYKQESINLQKENLRLRQEQVRLQRQRVELQQQKQDKEESNRWTDRQRNDIAEKAKLEEHNIKALESLKKQTTFNGARAAIIDEYAAKGQKYNPTVDEVNKRVQQAKKELQFGTAAYRNNYNAQSIKPKGDDMSTARDIFDNYQKPQPNGDINGGTSSKITFGKNSGLSLTKQKEAEYANRSYSAGSPTSKLHKYLNDNNISGFRHSEDVTVNHRTIGDGVSQWDVNGMVRIRKSDLGKLDKDKKWVGYGKSEEDLNRAIELAGGSTITMGSTSITTDRAGKPHKTYSATDWVILPVTRTADPYMHGDTEIDTWHQKTYGKKYAHQAESQFIDEDLTDDE